MSRILVPAPQAPVEPLTAPPTFSIVVPAYQAAGTVAASVTSALRQTYPAHEIIVVDDGSTDDLDGALDDYASAVNVVRKRNGGGASALNAGIEAASGEFMAILDADDTYHPRRLEALGELAASRPDLDLVTTDARFVVGDEVVGSFAGHNPFVTLDQRRGILRSCFVGGWPAVRLSRLRAIGCFDERLRTGYDWDCWLRLILDGSGAGLVDEPYYDYRLHPGSLTSTRASSLWDRVRLLEKAAANPALEPDERSALACSLRHHRSRAVSAETLGYLERGGSRRRLLRLAVSGPVDKRVRVAAGVAGTAPALARRLLPPAEPPAKRFPTRR